MQPDTPIVLRRGGQVMQRSCAIVPFATPPIALEGMPFWSGEGPLCRLPLTLYDKINEGVTILAWDTSGGMLRFATDSTYLGARVELGHISAAPHISRTGDSGLDFYIGTGADSRLAHTAKTMQGDCAELRYECLFNVPGPRQRREWTVYLPLYNGVRSLELLLEPGALLWAPAPRAVRKPIAFYGSSITQGGCAGRPGNSYAAMLSRRLDAPIVNLGFSGSGRGEPAMAELIGSLGLSAFVLDYDHNAPTPAHLRDTHEPFFTIVRRAQPDLPILMASMPPTLDMLEQMPERRAIIRRTYENAVAAGDRNVYFINGDTYYPPDFADECTVDGCHPNDLGFAHMARTMLPVLRSALQGAAQP